MTSKHADILNAIVEMQRSMHYAIRHRHLREAENLITSQEATIAKLVDACKEMREATLNLRGVIVHSGAMRPEFSAAFAKAFEADDKAQAAISATT